MRFPDVSNEGLSSRRLRPAELFHPASLEHFKI
jgi:hypothetical protein